jgi:predicted helicase
MTRILINQYYQELDERVRFGGTKNEQSLRFAFANLLNHYCKTRGFVLVDELYFSTKFNTKVRLDGIVKDALRLDWGYWEAKDEQDNLDIEIETKIAKGYPTDNILFEDSNTAVLIQNGVESLRVNMKNPDDLDKIINQFLDFERAEVKDFRQAINSFNQDLPIIIDTLRNLIDSQSPSPLTPLPKGEGNLIPNQTFIKTRDKLLKICQESINPNINIEDIREMIIQHILTEDIFTNIFNESQFHQENNIARQLQEVIKTFFTGDIKRNTLKSIQNYYSVIIRTASSIVNHHEKQKFLKVVYENFYKAYNPKIADRLGILYTPNEIVKFMVASTDYLLNKHFNKLLGDSGVEILDPATGTGTFITEILEYLLTSDLKYKYLNEIHCNEVSILPYYIANLNIEYTYQQKMGEYLEFHNICLVDTLDHTNFIGKQMDLFAMTQENTPPSPRCRGNLRGRQNECKISVIIGNPPYNANQKNENDNNKNREYPPIDKRIEETYIKESTAQKTKLYDMYSRFYRWATDRLNDDGIIAFITNSSFINARTFDGFRKVVSQEFDYIYIIDLGGNIRGGDSTGNVFNIIVGVAMCFLVKKSTNNKLPCQIYFTSLTNLNSGEEKLQFLASHKFEQLNFEQIKPDKQNNWINQTDNDFENLLPLVSKETKLAKTKANEQAVFHLFSNGIVTARDEWVFDFDKENLATKVKFFCEVYQQEKKRISKLTLNQNIDITNLVSRTIKWTSELESYLLKNYELEFKPTNIVLATWRPFTKKYLYYQEVIIHRLYQQKQLFPFSKDNLAICVTIHDQVPFVVQITDCIFDNGIGSRISQCLPLYRYENGERMDNITNWGLQQFRNYYQEKSLLSKGGWEVQINKLDIFYYIYAVLHNPKYRAKYELNLKREFPRIPFYDDFYQWVNWGKKLINLHLNYETIQPYELKRVDLPPLTSPSQGGKLELPPLTPPFKGGNKNKPKLKADKINGKIIIDEVTTLENIPSIAWKYQLGNRSALEWILDQYKEKKPKDQTIAEKFNNYRFADYKEQVIDLLMRVCTVSVETMKIIEEMTNISNFN